jgi:hypothetical protein
MDDLKKRMAVLTPGSAPDQGVKKAKNKPTKR